MHNIKRIKRELTKVEDALKRVSKGNPSFVRNHTRVPGTKKDHGRKSVFDQNMKRGGRDGTLWEEQKVGLRKKELEN